MQTLSAAQSSYLPNVFIFWSKDAELIVNLFEPYNLLSIVFGLKTGSNANMIQNLSLPLLRAFLLCGASSVTSYLHDWRTTKQT